MATMTTEHPLPEWHYGIWFVRGDQMDWMAKLVKRAGKVVLEYRFRYYADDKAFGFEDTKKWYTGEMKDDSDASLELALKGVQAILPAVEQELGHKADFVLMECANDDPKFLFELGSRPWAHLKIQPKE